MKKVAVGLSGGVDSAVAALLLKKRGFDVTGVFLYCFDQAGIPCTADEDRKMAVKVAASLDIHIKIIDLRRQYTKSVVDYFFFEYQAGRTPNPDVMCNKEIKFGLFYKEAIEKWGMDFVATGHYARVVTKSSFWGGAKRRLQNRFWTSPSIPRSSGPRGQNDGKQSLELVQGFDHTKDQSYFLYTLTSKQLEYILFPIGDFKKDKVRKIAKENKLPNWDRPDSQGICFVGEVNIKKFLRTKLKVQKGKVLDSNGNLIGDHDGAWFYTLGQRHGFRVTSKEVNKKPLFILSKNSDRNELVVGEKQECFRNEFIVNNFHWLNPGFFHPVILGRSRRRRLQNHLIDSGQALYRTVTGQARMTIRIRHLGEMYQCKIEGKNGFYSSSPAEQDEKSVRNSSQPAQRVSNNKLKVILERPAFAVAPGQSAVLYHNNIVLGGGIIS